MELDLTSILGVMSEQGIEGLILAFLIVKVFLDKKNGSKEASAASPGNGAVLQRVVDEVQRDLDTHRGETREEAHSTRTLIRTESEAVRETLGELTGAMNTLNRNLEEQTETIRHLNGNE